ncbi:MAG: hypothetical protein ACK526_11125 [Planctomyces sp.]
MVIVVGCVSSPKGLPNPPGGGTTRLYCFAPPNQTLKVVCYGTGPGYPHNNLPIPLAVDTSLNNQDRPAGIPSDWVSYASDEFVFGSYTYVGELQQFSGGVWIFRDNIDQWDGSYQLQLIHN